MAACHQTLKVKGLVATCHSFLRFYFFLSYDTLQDITSHNYYMMRQAFFSGAAVVSDGSHRVVVMRLGHDWFLYRIGGLKVTVSRGIFLANSPTGTRTYAPHIRGSSRVVSEW